MGKKPVLMLIYFSLFVKYLTDFTCLEVLHDTYLGYEIQTEKFLK